MLISPPFLPPRATDITDAAYLAMAMKEHDTGIYPVSRLRVWHGGSHLIAPPRGTGREPVRAVADGQICFVRPPTPCPVSATEREAHPLSYNGWTDDGCVVIRHDTSIGAATDDADTTAATETQVRFFSIYQHLSTVRALRTGEAIKRKAEIGSAGRISGEPHLIHFEIVCDEANLRHLLGSAVETGLPLARGRTDAVFGTVYFTLPTGTPSYVDRPSLTATSGTAGHAQLLPTPLGVGLTFDRGRARLISYTADGTTVGEPVDDLDGEYQLYDRAAAIVAAYKKAATVPSHSAVYELLRFGRVLGPDPLLPADVPHWRQIPTADGPRWVNLNSLYIHVLSDADTPQWAGWRLSREHGANDDSRCDIPRLQQLFDRNGDGIATEAEAALALTDPAVRAIAEGCVCLFPTEWHRGSMARRWSWVTREGPDGVPSPHSLYSGTHLTAATFPAFQRYAEALCFWEEANTGLDIEHWHFHPRRFISHFRRCGWLSEGELAQVYPDTATETRERYRLALNQCMRKYLFASSAQRMAHFLGQGAVESESLNRMMEGSAKWDPTNTHPSFTSEDNGYYADPTDRYQAFHRYERAGNDLGNVVRSELYDSAGNQLEIQFGQRDQLARPTLDQIDRNQSHVGDGMKFRGRGLKQLTGRANYADYWVYRGWLKVGLDFDHHWWTDPRKRAAPIDDPQRISINAYNCIDTGGQYCAKRALIRLADAELSETSSANVSRLINPKDSKSIARRWLNTSLTYKVLAEP